MKKAVAIETDEIDSSTETESLITNTPRRLSDHEKETSPSVSFMSEEVARQIKSVANPLIQKLAHLCQPMPELRNEQVNRHHEETASSRAANSSSGSAGLSDMKFSARFIFLPYHFLRYYLLYHLPICLHPWTLQKRVSL